MKKKDKLDKTIEELQAKEIPIVEVYHNISEEKEIVNILTDTIKQIGVKDTYLPFVLTKLKICANNTEARKFIITGRVKVNNKVVTQTHTTKELSNFLLEVDGNKWEIFKMD